MNAEIINPFIQASQLVFETICNDEPALGQIHVKSSPFSADRIIVTIGIEGDICGQVYFDLPQGTAQNIASVMMGGAPVSEMDELGRSAISEMGNMIMGNACSYFGRKSMQVNITPPVIVFGGNIEIPDRGPTIVIPLTLHELGTLTLNISMETKTVDVPSGAGLLCSLCSPDGFRRGTGRRNGGRARLYDRTRTHTLLFTQPRWRNPPWLFLFQHAKGESVNVPT